MHAWAGRLQQNQPAVLGARGGLCPRCWVHRRPGPSSPLLLLPLRRRELSDLVKEVQPAARRPMARLSFAFVYPDRRGRNVMRQVGAASCRGTNPPPTAVEHLPLCTPAAPRVTRGSVWLTCTLLRKPSCAAAAAAPQQSWPAHSGLMGAAYAQRHRVAARPQ